MKYITALEFKKRQNDDQVLLLDVREPYECDICSIGGLQIPMAEVANRVNEIDPSREIVVLCRTGKRAEAVGNLLMTEFNCPNVSIIDGGILAWIEQVDDSLELY